MRSHLLETRQLSVALGLTLLAAMAEFEGHVSRADDGAGPPAASSTLGGPKRANLQALRSEYRTRGGSPEAFRLEYHFGDGGGSYDNTRTEVLAIALSPDGRYLCTGNSNEKKGWDGFGANIAKRKGDFATARLWDLQTGREMRRFVGHKDCFACTSVAFSPDGKLLATCGHERAGRWLDDYGEETRLWDVRTGEELAHWEGIGWTVCFTRDGKHLVVLGYNGISLVEVPSQRIVQDHRLRRPGYTTSVRCWIPPVVMPDDRSVLFTQGNQVTRFDFQAGTAIGKFEAAERVEQFALSGDGNLVAAVDEEGLTVWDVQTGRQIRRLEPSSDRPFLDADFAAFTPDSRFVMAVGRGQRYVWNLENGKLSQTDRIGPGYFRISSDGRFLVHGDRCHIDVLETETGVPLARFHQFEEERHWMTETIDGYYAASKEYSSFMALDPKLEKAGLRQDPEKVAAVLSLLTSPTSSVAATPTPSRPTLTMKALRVFHDSADIHVVARPADGDARITDLRVSVDGHPVLFADKGRALGGPQPDSRIVYETAVKFPSGRSAVRVEAYVVDSQGQRSETAALTLRPLAAGANVHGRLFVLAVGVSKYKYDEYNLHYAHNDATALAEFFRNQKGRIYSDVVVQVYTGQKATRDNLLEGLDWLKRSCTPADGAIVLFAGHGIRGRKGLYFVTHEGDVEGIHYTCLNWSDVAERLAETEARQILLLSDCCHAGAFAAQRLASQDELARRIAEKAEVVFFASCRPNELALEDTKWEHGAFTFALLEGLNGKADVGEQDEKITLGELYEYVRRRVSELSGGRQTPDIPDFDRADDQRVIASMSSTD